MLVTEDYYYNFHFQKSVKKKTPNTKWKERQNQEQKLIFKSINERFSFS